MAYAANTGNDPTWSRKRYRFTGMERDEETGLQYHHHRYYMPWLGRWTRPDPAGLVDGVNRWGYAGGDPVGGTDPLGLEVVSAQPELQDVAKEWNRVLVEEGYSPIFGTELAGEISNPDVLNKPQSDDALSRNDYHPGPRKVPSATLRTGRGSRAESAEMRPAALRLTVSDDVADRLAESELPTWAREVAEAALAEGTMEVRFASAGEHMWKKDGETASLGMGDNSGLTIATFSLSNEHRKRAAAKMTDLRSESPSDAARIEGSLDNLAGISDIAILKQGKGTVSIVAGDEAYPGRTIFDVARTTAHELTGHAIQMVGVGGRVHVFGGDEADPAIDVGSWGVPGSGPSHQEKWDVRSGYPLGRRQ